MIYTHFSQSTFRSTSAIWTHCRRSYVWPAHKVTYTEHDSTKRWTVCVVSIERSFHLFEQKRKRALKSWHSSSSSNSRVLVMKKTNFSLVHNSHHWNTSFFDLSTRNSTSYRRSKLKKGWCGYLRNDKGNRLRNANRSGKSATICYYWMWKKEFDGRLHSLLHSN